LFVAICAACNLHIRNYEEDFLQEEDTSPQMNEVTIMKVNEYHFALLACTFYICSIPQYFLQEGLIYTSPATVV
jgi:hypothetical protein